MPQTHRGAMKALAKKRGMTIDELMARFETENYCYGCQQWKPHASFGRDASRWNGLARKCDDCRSMKSAAPLPRPPSPLRGRKATPEARARMSAAQRGNQNRLGKPCSIEQRRNLSQ